MEIISMIAETIYQNVIAFDAADGMFNQDADTAQGFVVGLLGLGQASVRVLLAFARFLVWALNLLASIVGLQTEVTQVNEHRKVNEPVEFRGQFCFEHRIIMMVTAKGVAQKHDHFLRSRYHRVLERVTFFYHCNARAVAVHPAVVDKGVLWHQ